MHSFVHLTDLHFWQIVCNPQMLLNKRFWGNLNLIIRRRRHIRQELAQSVIEIMREIRPDGILLGGDLTSTATDQEFQRAADFVQALDDAKIPVYAVQGNHDCYTFESQRQRRFESYFGAYEIATDHPAIKRLPGDVSLLSLPTARPNMLSSRGYISHDQLEETRNLLNELTPGIVVALAHYPLLSCTQAYHSGWGRRLRHACRLRTVLGESGHSILYLAGHVHRFSHVRDPLFPSMEYVTSNALFYQKRGCLPGFTEIRMENGIPCVYPWRYDGTWRRMEQSHS